jgi:hypothetical protein
MTRALFSSSPSLAFLCCVMCLLLLPLQAICCLLLCLCCCLAACFPPRCLLLACYVQLAMRCTLSCSTLCATALPCCCTLLLLSRIACSLACMLLPCRCAAALLALSCCAAAASLLTCCCASLGCCCRPSCKLVHRKRRSRHHRCCLRGLCPRATAAMSRTPERPIHRFPPLQEHLTTDGARRVFDEMPRRDTVAWNAVTAGYIRAGCFGEAVVQFS